MAARPPFEESVPEPSTAEFFFLNWVQGVHREERGGRDEPLRPSGPAATDMLPPSVKDPAAMKDCTAARELVLLVSVDSFDEV